MTEISAPAKKAFARVSASRMANSVAMVGF
jgi:hypothetical protein